MAALGFQPGTLLGIQRHYGDQLLEGIQQGGRIIEQGLKQITTKRQLEGLGQTLSQLNPESPDYPQELIKVGAQFPFAMQDPRGQALMSIGAKAHAQWQQAQQVTRQADLTFNRQKQMEEIRFRNRQTLAAEKPGTQMVNLNDFRDGLPRGRMGLGTDETQFQEPEEVSGASPNVPLFGQKGGLRDIAADVARDLPGVDKMPVTQFAPMLRQERTFRQQVKMQEDRQSEAEKKTADKTEKDKQEAAAKEAREEKRFQQADKVQQRLILDSQKDSIDREISQHRSALNAHLRKDGKKNAEFYAQKSELEGILQEAGERLTKITERLDSIGKETADEKVPVIHVKTGKRGTLPRGQVDEAIKSSEYALP